MSQNNSILDLFNLKDENIKIGDHITSLQPHGWRLHTIEARLTYELQKCPNCGFSTLIKNGTSLSHIRLNSLTGDKYVLELRRQRYLCHNCHTTCGAETDIVKKNQTFCRSIQHQVITLARDMLTAKEIAKIVGISPSSVQRLLNKDIHIAYRVKNLPENLSFDEFRSCGNRFSFICCDAKTHNLVTLINTRLSKNVIDYFESRYSILERIAVKTVVVDMNAEYLHFIHRLFPNAVTIIDRFHIIQLAGRALDTERMKVLNAMPDKSSRDYRLLKGQWKLFHLSEDDIEDSKPIYLKGINEWMTQRNAIDLITSKYQRFSQVYQTYQDILSAVRTHDADRLGRLLNEYQPNGSATDVVINTLKKQRAAVLNSCRYTFSNGPIEGINRKIKALKRICFGFRNLHNFFIRITLIHA